jgi:hypothetical protein
VNPKSNAGHGWTPVFSLACQVFYRLVDVTVALSSWMQAFEDSSFLPAMYFVSESYEELFIHHAVERHKLSCRLIQCVDALTDERNSHTTKAEPVNHAKGIWDISR